MNKSKLGQVSTMPKRNADQKFKPTENQELVYNKLVQVLRPYARLMKIPPIMSKLYIIDTQMQFELLTAHPYKKNKGILFAGASIRKEGYVGLYFFPLFKCPSLKHKLPAQLARLQNGASVFHIVDLNDQLLNEVMELLNIGVKYYQELGWI
jgi:hypothetical protein